MPPCSIGPTVLLSVRKSVQAKEARLIQSRHFASGANTRLWHEVETETSGVRGWLREDVLAPSTATHPVDELILEPAEDEQPLERT